MPLAYYSRAATQEFWSEHWGGQDVDRLVRIAATSPLTELIEGALPPSGRILEAGCGLGQYVILLRERGRAVTGVDWSLDALGRCKRAVPAAPVAAMDLVELAVKSGAVAAYVSLGVVEHDEHGPGAIVAEAARVLAPGGRLVLSVPYWNGARRLLASRVVREGRRIRAAGGAFYQFAFTRQEVRAFLEAHGFRVLSFHPYDPARMWRTYFRRLAGGLDGTGAAASVTDDGASHRAPVSPRRLARAAVKRILYSEIGLRLFGHMILAVAVKSRDAPGAIAAATPARLAP
ncbi:MAG TPA: class I SAM-dependent methyltransferase [Candidatus Methylomirabilis sp.]|nr:class I SAM-dependent methyltransferase [Candidatus Methylomirabilis sp.]